MGAAGAVAAAGAVGIDLVCGVGLRWHLPARRIGGLALPLVLALGPALGAGAAATMGGVPPWLPAAVALPLFVLLACAVGLVPDSRRTLPLAGAGAGA
jgi:hypothetical protein